MSSIVVHKIAYELTKEPKHGVVRKIRKERQNSIKEFLALFADGLNQNADIDKEIERLVKEHPSEAVEFGDIEAEFNVRSTISLAASHYFAEEDFDEMTEKEIQECYEKAKEVLGGDVNAFFA